MNDDTLLSNTMTGITLCLGYSVAFQALHWASSFIPLHLVVWIVLAIAGISALVWLFWRKDKSENLAYYLAIASAIGMLLGAWA